VLSLPDGRTAARWGATLAIGAVGGATAQAIGAPLPWMLGGLVATAAAATGGLRLLGAPPVFPVRLRLAFIPVIGVLIGGALTPETLRAAADWWPALASVAPFVVACHLANFWLFRRLGGLSKATAFFAGMPGGLVESVELGEKHGADMPPLVALQFLRIAATVSALPLLFMAVEGRALGSAAGESIGHAAPLGLADAALLIFAGVAGYVGAKAVRLPAGQILGPIIVSGALHAAGWTQAAPPGWLVALAQLVIGVSLGVRFSGVDGPALRRLTALSAVSVAVMLAIGSLWAAAFAAAGFAPFMVMLLALAPGGIVEMGLIALSLDADPIFVTACHVVRIVLTVAIGATLWRRFA
jgi:membrane AbrB-like protein